MEVPQWGFPRIRGTIYNKDYSIWAVYVYVGVPLIWGSYQILILSNGGRGASRLAGQ